MSDDTITQEEIEAFGAHLEELEEQYGVELTEEAAEEIAQASLAAGFTTEATEEAFTSAVAEQHYIDESLEDYEQQTGRELDETDAQAIVNHAAMYPDENGIPDMTAALNLYHQATAEEDGESDYDEDYDDDAEREELGMPTSRTASSG